MTVLDASAVLALLRDEPGAERVEGALPAGTISAVNLAEVVGKLVDAGIPPGPAVDLLVDAGVRVAAFTAQDAVVAGALRSLAGTAVLSLGGRCCLALASRSDPADVLTADRAWSGLDLPVRVLLIR